MCVGRENTLPLRRAKHGLRGRHVPKIAKERGVETRGSEEGIKQEPSQKAPHCSSALAFLSCRFSARARGFASGLDSWLRSCAIMRSTSQKPHIGHKPPKKVSKMANREQPQTGG